MSGSFDGGAGIGPNLDAASSPIRGFTVLSIAYPNHLHPDCRPMSNCDIAPRLCHDMAVNWFGKDLLFAHFGVTGPLRGNAENDDAFGFEFGPYDDTSETLKHDYTVIVRETAGGGFMLLIRNNAMAFAAKIRELFDVVADPERENPELPDDDEVAG